MTVLSPTKTVRTLSVSHNDHRVAGHLVQDAVATAQLEGWTIQSVVCTPSLTSHSYEITASRSESSRPSLAA